MRKYNDLIESIKTLMEESPPISKGGQTIGKPTWSPFQNKSEKPHFGKTQPFEFGKLQHQHSPIPSNIGLRPTGSGVNTSLPKTKEEKDIHHFASHISPTSGKPGPGLPILQKPSKENLQYAAHVHEAASKFKDDDQAAEHLHNRMNPKIRSPFAVQPPEYHTLSDDQKNLYKQHVQHMRNVVSGQKFRQLVK